MNYGIGKNKLVQRGPYGTNEGDVWHARDSDVGRMLWENDGLTLVHEIIQGEEKVYTTDNPEMVARAEAGYELWAAAQAAQN